MKIISIANTKGGIGKTTIAICLYYAFVQTGTKTALMELDPQESIRNLQEMATGDSKINLLFSDSVKDLKRQAKGNEIVIIDYPPFLNLDKQKQFLKASDIIVMPVKTFALDVFATIQTHQIYDKLGIPIVAMLSLVKGKNSLTDSVRLSLKEHDINVLNSQISNRLAYGKFVVSGMTFNQFKDNRIKMECQDLATEILTKLL